MQTGNLIHSILFGITVLCGIVLSAAPNHAVAESVLHSAALTKVDAKHVCMVTNRVYENEQIPISVGTKTYYGCCEMCKEKLATEKSTREAIDPVTRRTVDKASAIFGATPSGEVLYFENAQNFNTFVAAAH